MANRDVISAVKKSLKAYLAANISGVGTLTINEDFPTPSENLSFPCITIITGQPQFQHEDPYVISKGSVQDTDPTGGVNRQSLVQYCVGQMNFTLQLDLWAAYRPKRDELFDKVFKAINKNVSKMALDLQLTDYYSQYAHFFILDFRPVDDEAARQRKEYRYIVNLECSVNVVMEKLENIIETIENNTSITDEEIEDDSSESDTTII